MFMEMSYIDASGDQRMNWDNFHVTWRSLSMSRLQKCDHHIASMPSRPLHHLLPKQQEIIGMRIEESAWRRVEQTIERTFDKKKSLFSLHPEKTEAGAPADI